MDAPFVATCSIELGIRIAVARGSNVRTNIVAALLLYRSTEKPSVPGAQLLSVRLEVMLDPPPPVAVNAEQSVPVAGVDRQASNRVCPISF